MQARTSGNREAQTRKTSRCDMKRDNEKQDKGDHDGHKRNF